MTFFSLTLQTTTGYGNIYPASSWTRFIVTVHMVIADIYAIVIFGLGLNVLTTKIGKKLEERIKAGKSVVSKHN
jgi:hypothetical protein